MSDLDFKILPVVAQSGSPERGGDPQQNQHEEMLFLRWFLRSLGWVCG